MLSDTLFTYITYWGICLQFKNIKSLYIRYRVKYKSVRKTDVPNQCCGLQIQRSEQNVHPLMTLFQKDEIRPFGLVLKTDEASVKALI